MQLAQKSGDRKVEPETYWKRKPPGREVVQVQRVWYWPGQGWTIRAHPTKGGRILVADQDWFLEHYERWKGQQ